MTAPETPTKPRLYLDNGNGHAILNRASTAAGKGGWTHQEWLVFRRKAHRLEWEEMFAMVMSRFDVHCGPKFSADPLNWRVETFGDDTDE